MTLVIIIAACMVAALITSILLKPSVTVGRVQLGTYWIVALIGALLLIFTGRIGIREVFDGLTRDSAINPIKILVLFLSMTLQSVFLDEVGMFRYLANETLKKACGKQKTLFLYLYLIVSVLTVFTSNDIIILTFTPFICYFCKNAKINPIPYLFTEFVAANTWSMALIIGNPTNVYLATASGISFVEYIRVMLLPTLFGGATALYVLYLVFRRSLDKDMDIEYDNFQIEDRPLLWIGVVHLTICTLLLVVSSYIGLEMWLITMCFALSLLTIAGLYIVFSRRHSRVLLTSIKRLPWELIPFVLSMFIFVLTFDSWNLTGRIADMLTGGNYIFKYGIVSFITANLVNNIPMSVLFSSIVQNLDAVNRNSGIYAAIVGSNIGAFFTPIGALAGIMWTGILKKQNVTFSFVTYIRYGVIIAIPTLIATLTGLMIVNP